MSASRPFATPLLIILLLVSGTANTLAYKILYSVYTQKYAYFVANGINVWFVLIGGILLYPRLYCAKVRPESTRNQPQVRLSLLFTHCLHVVYTLFTHYLQVVYTTYILRQYKYIVMALLDACGTFLSSMGSVNTPGFLQTILNQTVIPITMVLSAKILKTGFTFSQVSGAVLIFIGALISSSSSLLSPSSARISPLPILFYAASTIPSAMSAVYKEHAFRNSNQDVMYMTQQVSIYQMFIGWAMIPLVSIPGIATPEGMTVPAAFQNLSDGTECFLEFPQSHCHNTFLLLAGYCSINFVYNALGLVLTQQASSTVNAIAGSLLLPITAIAFTAPIMGQFREEIKLEAVWGLCVIVAGFGMYQYGSYVSVVVRVEDDMDEAEELLRKRGDSKGFGSPKLVYTFQEKVAAVKIRHGTKAVAGEGGCVGLEGLIMGNPNRREGGTGGEAYGSLDEKDFKWIRGSEEYNLSSSV